MNSRYVDWNEEWLKDEWEFTGADLMYQKACNQEPEDYTPEEIQEQNMPMYNYAYQLERTSIEDSVIRRVCEKTSCTVVYNQKENSYYLALTGCGMDLSQDIALAYMIVDGCVNWDMLEDVYIHAPISVSKQRYFEILKQMKSQLKIRMDSYKNRIEKIDDRLFAFSKPLTL